MPPLLLTASFLTSVLAKNAVCSAGKGECQRFSEEDEIVFLQTSMQNTSRSNRTKDVRMHTQNLKSDVDAEKRKAPGWQLQKLDLWRYPHAQCLDGSVGSFYIQSSSTNASAQKWVIHHQGGSWCTLDVPDRDKGWEQVEHCLQRTTRPLGSSVPLAASLDVEKTGSIKEGELSPNKRVNPLMYDWNHVYLNYCDGGSFSGRNVTPTIVHACTDESKNSTCSTRELHFKGNYILEAVMQTLLEEHNLGLATDVVLSGCGSGGLAVLLHADQWKATLPASTLVTALVDSGFFLDWSISMPATEPRDFGNQLRSVFLLHNASGSMSEVCVKKQTELGDPTSACFFPEQSSTYLEVPTFLMQSTVDSFQLKAVLGVDTKPDEKDKVQTTETVNAYRKYMALAMNMSLLSQHQNGAFVSTCQYHCGHFNTMQNNGFYINSAHSKWYGERKKVFDGHQSPDSGESMRIWQDKDWTCHDCCNPTAIQHDEEEAFSKSDDNEGRPTLVLDDSEANTKVAGEVDETADDAEEKTKVKLREEMPADMEDMNIVDSIIGQKSTAESMGIAIG